MVSQLDAKANLQGIDEILGAMTRSSFALQEGCATLVELLFRTRSQEPGALERRMKSLPLPYYLSVQYYGPLFTGVIQAFEDPRYASLSVTFIDLMICALASSCLAVDILDEFAIYSQISLATVTAYLSVRDRYSLRIDVDTDQFLNCIEILCNTARQQATSTAHFQHRAHGRYRNPLAVFAPD